MTILNGATVKGSLNPYRAMVLYFVMFASLALAHFAAAQSPSPREILKQQIADLQKTPNDQALREKIVKLAATLQPRPAVPDEARRHMVRGQAAFENAKAASDYQNAVGEFQQAANVAPWWGDAYYNLAVAQDKAGSYAAAVSNIKLYLLTEPNDADASAAKDLMYKIEYRKENAEQAVAARRTQENFLRSLNGATFLDTNKLPGQFLRRITISGNKARVQFLLPGVGWDNSPRGSIQIDGDGRKGIILDDDGKCRVFGAPNCGTFTISADGEFLNLHYFWDSQFTPPGAKAPLPAGFYDTVFQRQR